MKQNNKELNELEQQENLDNNALNDETYMKYYLYIYLIGFAGITVPLGVLYYFNNEIFAIKMGGIFYTLMFLSGLYQNVNQTNNIKKELDNVSKLFMVYFITSELQKRADKNLANKNKEYAVAFLREIKEHNLRDEDTIIKKVKYDQILSDSNKNIVLNELMDAGFLPTVATTLPKLVNKKTR